MIFAPRAAVVPSPRIASAIAPSRPVSNFPATLADLPAKVASRVGFLGSAS